MNRNEEQFLAHAEVGKNVFLSGMAGTGKSKLLREFIAGAGRKTGQAYVAVSRVRGLSGLHFKHWFKGVHVSPEAIRFYEGCGSFCANALLFGRAEPKEVTPAPSRLASHKSSAQPENQ